MAEPQKRRGKWRIQWIDAYGVRKSETYSSKSTAEKVLHDKIAEAEKIKGGLVKPLSDKTFAETVEEWKKTRPEKRLKDDEGRLRVHILPFLGEYRLPDINQEVLKRFIRHMETKKKTISKPIFEDGKRQPGSKAFETNETLKPMTIKNCLVLVSKILNDAGYPQRIKYKVATSGYAWIADAHDVGKFLAAFKAQWAYVASAIAVYAGLRKGEVAGLRKDAVDFERGLIRVDRSYEGPVKSKHMRWVPLAPALATILKTWFLQHPGELAVTIHGKPITEETTLVPYVARACKKAGVGRVTFHQLRHTAASHLAQRVPLPLVGAVLGHADPKTTARYAHLDTEGVARDPRLHLNFEQPSGKVLEFPSKKGRQAKESAPVVHPDEIGGKSGKVTT